MDNSWVNILSSSSAYEVEIVAALLRDNEIDCVVVNQKDSMYLFGEVQLFVGPENVSRARELIMQNL